MDKAEASEEIKALREGVQHHNYLYYIRNQPAIADETYDKLFRRPGREKWRFSMRRSSRC